MVITYPTTVGTMKGSRKSDKPVPSSKKVKEEQLSVAGSGRGADTALAKLKQIERIKSRLRPRDGPSST
jgi:hypothetical protein